ncbi:MAG: ribbon-helix-helix domain-containing protein [Alphaproteobacteria bacterium]
MQNIALDGSVGRGNKICQAGQSSLVSRNITILGRRTSVRLEPEMWVSLNDIADRERCSVHDICSLVYVRKSPLTSLTAAIRVFLMLYYKAAATDTGHKEAGHGNFEIMKKRARIPEGYERFFKTNQINRRRRCAGE